MIKSKDVKIGDLYLVIANAQKDVLLVQLTRLSKKSHPIGVTPTVKVLLRMNKHGTLIRQKIFETDLVWGVLNSLKSSDFSHILEGLYKSAHGVFRELFHVR